LGINIIVDFVAVLARCSADNFDARFLLLIHLSAQARRADRASFRLLRAAVTPHRSEAR
jgi:hypothetical protein